MPQLRAYLWPRSSRNLIRIFLILGLVAPCALAETAI